mmetsp:Transcript_21915/g.34089  ORF Transcript_21915/g.34089 Transcript_21915/m.34089 type:complete len:228 (+) Transcript_21915:4548-5231(+)
MRHSPRPKTTGQTQPPKPLFTDLFFNHVPSTEKLTSPSSKSKATPMVSGEVTRLASFINSLILARPNKVERVTSFTIPSSTRGAVCQPTLPSLKRARPEISKYQRPKVMRQLGKPSSSALLCARNKRSPAGTFRCPVSFTISAVADLIARAVAYATEKLPPSFNDSSTGSSTGAAFTARCNGVTPPPSTAFTTPASTAEASTTSNATVPGEGTTARLPSSFVATFPP